MIEELRLRCLGAPLRIALPEITDIRVLSAAITLCHSGAFREIHTLLPRNDLDNLLARNQFANHSALIPLESDQQFFSEEDGTVLQQSGSLLRLDVVDAVLAGATHTTAEVIRAAISSVGVAEDIKTISGGFLMTNPSGKSFMFADCGVVIEPSVAQLVDIAVGSVQTWQILFPKHAPVVAFLSFSTKGSAQHDHATKVAKAAQIFQQRFPDIDADGELQFDAALIPKIGQRKCPGSRIPGRANIFVFPNLSAGNICYKALERLAGYAAFGPILQGANKPFSDLSRGASPEDIVASAYINGLRATTRR